MIRTRSGEVVYYEFESMHSLPKLRCTVLTRLGGVSLAPFASLNVGHFVGDDPAAVQINERRVFSVLGVQEHQIVTPHQVHGSAVRRVGRAQCGSIIPGTDGLVTDERDVALMLRFADCVPVLLYDATHGAVGLLHAGWRGWAAGVVANALRLMYDEFGTRPEHVLAGIGPSIGPCCYTVGQDVIAEVKRVLGNASEVLTPVTSDSSRLDLPAAVRIHLESHGVARVELSGICTSCSRHEFFSHRAERGRTGRFAVTAMLC